MNNYHRVYMTFLTFILFILFFSGCNKSSVSTPVTNASLESPKIIKTSTLTSTVVMTSATPIITDETNPISVIRNVAQIPSGQYVILKSSDGNKVELLSENGTRKYVWLGLNDPDNNQYIESISFDGNLVFVNRTEEPSKIIDLMQDRVTDLFGFSNCYNARFSPNSNELIASCRIDSDNNNHELFLFDIAKGTKVQLTDCYPEDCGDFISWSPTGEYIAYRRVKLSSGELTPTEGIYLINVSCLKSPSCENPITGSFGFGVFFTWSPDGTRLATGFQPSEGDASIRILKLFDSKFKVERELKIDSRDNMAWSPDGEYLAFGPYIYSLTNGNLVSEHDDGTVLGWLSIP